MQTGTAKLTIDAVEEDLEARFRSFVASHTDRAVRVAWRLVGGDEAAAKDVAQEAFLNAYRALPRFREEASLETWFYRILVRRAHNYRRWLALRKLWGAPWLDDPPDPAPSAGSDPMLRRRIAKALDRLTRRQREAFVLVHVDGFSVRQAAEMLGMPAGTLKSHLHRALTKLRAELEDLGNTLVGGGEDELP